jgi:uncharacterized protein YjbI with pentapeptide repeats
MLTGANLSGANLSGANLVGADLFDATLDGAVYSLETRFPPGFDPDMYNMKLGKKGTDAFNGF